MDAGAQWFADPGFGAAPDEVVSAVGGFGAGECAQAAGQCLWIAVCHVVRLQHAMRCRARRQRLCATGVEPVPESARQCRCLGELNAEQTPDATTGVALGAVVDDLTVSQQGIVAGAHAG